jgi:hypothetical protein
MYNFLLSSIASLFMCHKHIFPFCFRKAYSKKNKEAIGLKISNNLA